MSLPHSARTAAACRIAGIDRQKLTDAIASGDYPCAPRTTAGRARVFNTSDLIALHLYTRLVSDDFPSRKAGNIACAVRDQLEATPDADHVRLTKAQMGSFSSTFQPLFDPTHTHMGGLPLFYHFVFDLRPIRQSVQNALAEEAGIVGEDE